MLIYLYCGNAKVLISMKIAAWRWEIYFIKELDVSQVDKYVTYLNIPFESRKACIHIAQFTSLTVYPKYWFVLYKLSLTKEVYSFPY